MAKHKQEQATIIFLKCKLNLTLVFLHHKDSPKPNVRRGRYDSSFVSVRLSTIELHAVSGTKLAYLAVVFTFHAEALIAPRPRYSVAMVTGQTVHGSRPADAATLLPEPGSTAAAAP